MAKKRDDIRAAVFDVDGTLLDTIEFIMQGFVHALQQHGCEVPPEDELREIVAGPTIRECYARLVPGRNSAPLIEIHRAFQMKRLDLIRKHEGLDEVLGEFKKRKKMALAACSTRGSTLRPSLEYTDITRYFDVIVCGEMVSEHKPHPEGVLKACTMSGVDPGRAVMIGDTPTDIEAGKRAGCAFTIGISHGFTSREKLVEAGADHVVDHLRDLLPLF